MRKSGRRTRLMIGGLGVAMLAGACGGFDREGSIDQLENDLGIPRPQATCMVDRLVEELGEDRVTSDDNPTQEELQVILEVTQECSSAS